MTPLQFVDKWRPVTLTERASAQEHFIDLCRLFDHPTPVEADKTGQDFTFEKGVTKAGGGEGFADVWKRGFFAWEYKKRRRNLDDALGQLSRYALALENPPLQVACDTERFRIITAYTNSVPRSYDLTLEEILDSEKRSWLEAAFYAPTKLKPGAKRSDLTGRAADKFSTLAQRLQAKRHAPEDVAHFVNRLVFLFFAEDVGLLKDGFFRRTVAELAGRPGDAQDLLTALFRTFQKGGRFGLDRLPWINGGLFDDREALPLDEHEIGLLKAASSQDWAHIDPTIFGTLFERFLDPDKRAQIGAHYTDAGKIGQIIEPVILRPLREEWRAARADIEVLVKKASAKGAKSKDWQRAEERRSAFLERLRTLSILDPACGSGNFLYLALHGVKDLEHAANQECESMGLPPRMPMVGPEILRGIEINPLAAELARTTIWIGDIQWAIQNGIRSRPEPILRRLDMIERRDALLAYEPTHASAGAAAAPMPVPASWPPAEMIIGNPPFLGGKLLRNRLGDDAVDELFSAYRGVVAPEADLVTYWFAQAKREIERNAAKRIGFVTTNSIRGGANRRVLESATADAPIFDAWSDEPWIVDGAAVRVSLVCFGKGEASRRLNGAPVPRINSDLTGSSVDLTTARRLNENLDIAFMGDTKGGAFDIPGDLARAWLAEPLNVNGRGNADVLRPWINGLDVTRRPRDMWIIDFGDCKSDNEIAFYEKPYAYALKNIKPERVNNRRETYARFWWRHVEPRPKLKTRMANLHRYIVTPRVAKHRVFAWYPSQTVPDCRLFAFMREDDFSFGVLCSNYHKQWSLRTCSWHGVGNDPTYNSESCFETFPFPSSDRLSPNNQAVAECARRLDRLRCAWLTPPDLVRVEPEVVPGYPDRVLPRDAAASAKLKGRTLTALYNERPAWLDKAHHELDAAVAASYGWPENISTEDALAALLNLNRERAAQAVH